MTRLSGLCVSSLQSLLQLTTFNCTASATYNVIYTDYVQVTLTMIEVLGLLYILQLQKQALYIQFHILIVYAENDLEYSIYTCVLVLT